MADSITVAHWLAQSVRISISINVVLRHSESHLSPQ